jgi:hypothetical protein
MYRTPRRVCTPGGAEDSRNRTRSADFVVTEGVMTGPPDPGDHPRHTRRRCERRRECDDGAEPDGVLLARPDAVVARYAPGPVGAAVNGLLSR